MILNPKQKDPSESLWRNLKKLCWSQVDIDPMQISVVFKRIYKILCLKVISIQNERLEL